MRQVLCKVSGTQPPCVTIAQLSLLLSPLSGRNPYLPVGVECGKGCIQHTLADIRVSVIEGIRDKKLKERLHLRAVQTLGELVQGQSQATPGKAMGACQGDEGWPGGDHLRSWDLSWESRGGRW